MNEKKDPPIVLVTGLTLCVNRGGPAMALSFMDLIQKELPMRFIFAVPRSRWNLEKQWAKKYGVQITPMGDITDNILRRIPRPFMRYAFFAIKRRYLSNDRLQEIYAESAWVMSEFQEAIRSSDCVININGIAFVGDGTRSWISSFHELSSSYFSKAGSKPFFRFTQSYGPFDHVLVRIIARHEFLNLPCIMCRGDISARNCSAIVPEKNVYSFPDVATVLNPASEEWVAPFLTKYHLKSGDFIVLSPSAVIYGLPTAEGTSLGKNHIAVFSNLVNHFTKLGTPVIFVPHTTSPNLNECDRYVSDRILATLGHVDLPSDMCQVIREELDCKQLKAVIGASRFAVVSRYHALVAALSSGVPVVSLGWNDKYQDLLNFYTNGDCAVDSRSGPPDMVTEQIIVKLHQWDAERRDEMVKRQNDVDAMVRRSIKLCAEWITRQTEERDG